MIDLDAKGFDEKREKVVGSGCAWAKLTKRTEVFTSETKHFASEAKLLSC